MFIQSLQKANQLCQNQRICLVLVIGVLLLQANILVRQLQTSLRDRKLLCPGQFLQISTSSVIRWFFLGFVYKKDPILQVVVELEEIAPRIIRLRVADNSMIISTTHQIFLAILELHSFQCDEFAAEIWAEGMFEADYSQRFGNHFRLTPSSSAEFNLGKNFDAWAPLHSCVVLNCFDFFYRLPYFNFSLFCCFIPMDQH